MGSVKQGKLDELTEKIKAGGEAFIEAHSDWDAILCE